MGCTGSACQTAGATYTFTHVKDPENDRSSEHFFFFKCILFQSSAGDQDNDTFSLMNRLLTVTTMFLALAQVPEILPVVAKQAVSVQQHEQY